MVEEALREEERLDGIFIIKSTASDLLAEELIQQYKNLTGVEKAFKEIKDFLRLRPIRHHEDNRVRAHVFICVLSYLLEKILEKKMRQAHLQITAREALDRLDDIRLAKNEVAGRVFLCPVESKARHKEVFDAVGIKNIPRILTT